MVGLTASVDIGGTFTDIILQKNNEIVGYYKVPTTPKEPEVGLAHGLGKYADRDIENLIHATTIATNALLGQHGLELPRVALLSTRGFRDVVEIGRQNRPNLYDLFFEKPKQIVQRNLRFEIDERVDSKGAVVKKLRTEDVEKLADKIKKESPGSIAVSFINSYLNSSNEEEANSVLSGHFSYVTTSSHISPEQREYERTSTAVVNAALMPIVSRYIRNLEKKLVDFGSPGISVMASSGGLVSTNEVFSRPVQIVESGPAAGVIASSEVSRILGLGNVISFDMGGTTAKAGTVVNGEVSITSEYEVGGKSHHGRMNKGSGYPVRFPFVDLAEVSAGGGTVIWKDQAGALKIGPVSAGAEPGPICYGKGGAEPTITDANLVLGMIGSSLLGGQMSLDVQGAISGLSILGEPYEVAESAISLADLEMARAIRIVTVERGLDPSDFTLMAFGGAGPQHAARIADELGITKVVIAPKPGVFSALGLLFSDWRYESRRPFPQDTESGFQDIENELAEKHPGSRFLRYADCRYRGQGSELTVAVSDASRPSIEELFRKLHFSTYGFNLEREVEIVAIRVFAVSERKKPGLSADPAESHPVSSRDAVIRGEKISLMTYARPGLIPDQVVSGPCSIDDYDSSTFVPEGWNASAGSIGEINLRRNDWWE